MYAIVKTGGKQYRVQEGQYLLVERLPVPEGESVDLRPLLVVDGADMLDGAALEGQSVQAKILAHERGPKLRIVKFKPKRGYKRRNGHRQELTRIEITTIPSPTGSKSKPKAAAAAPAKAEAPAALELTGESAPTSSEVSDGA
jgi:large subunit ribosomal protein L21